MDYKVLIPFTTFLLIFIAAYKRKNDISMVIVGLYLLSSFSSFFMDGSILPSHNFKDDEPFIFLLYALLLAPFLLITLYIRPFTSIDDLPRGRIFNILLVFLSIGTLFSIFYLTPYAIISLAKSATEVRRSLDESNVLPSNYLTTLAVGFPTFYFLYALLFYVSIIQKRHFIIKLSMLLGVLSFAINVFAVAGRDGVLFGGISMVVGYFLFKPLLKSNIRKVLKIVFIIFSSVAAFLIIEITGDRFGTFGAFDLRAFKRGIVSYLGMQPYIFSDWIQHNEFFDYGHKSFNLIMDLFGVNDSPVRFYRDPYTWMFGTFLTSFYAISGFSSLFLLSLGFLWYFQSRIKLINQDKYYPLGVYFFLGFYFHFIISGIFYFRLGNDGGNLFIIISVLVVILWRKRKLV